MVSQGSFLVFYSTTDGLRLSRHSAGNPDLGFQKISGQISSVLKSLVDNRMGNSLLHRLGFVY